MAEAIKGDEYLTVAETAEMLDCTIRAVQQTLDRNNLARFNCIEHQLSELKQVGVLPMKTPQAMLLIEAVGMLRPTVRSITESANLATDKSGTPILLCAIAQSTNYLSYHSMLCLCLPRAVNLLYTSV